MLPKPWVSDSPNLTVRVWHEPVEQFYWWDVSCSIYRLHSRNAASNWSPAYQGKMHFCWSFCSLLKAIYLHTPIIDRKQRDLLWNPSICRICMKPSSLPRCWCPLPLLPNAVFRVEGGKHKIEWTHKVGISHRWYSVLIVFQTFTLKQ